MKTKKETDDRLLSVQQVADLLSVKLSKAYQMVKEKELASMKIGKLIRIRKSEVFAFINKNAA